MRYLPILGELFASDAIIFFVIGVVIFVFAGIRMRSLKRNLKGVGVCFAIYAVCEAFSNIRTNNLLELILLFAGTIALGGILGFFVGIIVSGIRKTMRKNKT